MDGVRAGVPWRVAGIPAAVLIVLAALLLVIVYFRELVVRAGMARAEVAERVAERVPT